MTISGSKTLGFYTDIKRKKVRDDITPSVFVNVSVGQQSDLLHVGFNAADEERVGSAQSGHEGVQGVLRRRRREES